MIGSLGLPEMLFILVVALLIFGPRKLPEIGRTMGKALGEFRRATSDLKRTLDVEMSEETYRKPPAKSGTLETVRGEPTQGDTVQSEKVPGVVSPVEQAEGGAAQVAEASSVKSDLPEPAAAEGPAAEVVKPLEVQRKVSLPLTTEEGD